ncbi:MAG: hypothetical protein OEQ94_04310 [Nitrosopumilus sp.]|nr:hypothetical protein [Nitrosopumilus sp.]MDH3823486.1 hypothetical protein [Nitrosopumilus sp.]MDH3834143.1 hypothetical protein [Nitrosopumilus sp.]
MQDTEDNQSTLNEIALKIRENLEPIFIGSFSEPNSQFEHLEGIQELVSWYKKTRKEENILEKILEDIINETMKYLPQQYASLCVENIKINSKEKKQNIKFNISFQLESIKSYVEFAINVNKIRKKTGRIVFEINSSGTIKEVEIFLDREKVSQISLGVISGVIGISIIEVPFMKLNEPIEIGTKEIEIDLSQYHVGANNY